jgi:ankyrin repeat protein
VAGAAVYAATATILLEHGFSVEDEVLQEAIRKGDSIRKGYSTLLHVLVTTKDADGRTLLHLAAVGGHHEQLGILLDAGGSVDAGDRHGNTPLHLAVRNGHNTTVDMLVTRGATVKLRNSNGETAIHSATDWGLTAQLLQTMTGAAPSDREQRDSCEQSGAGEQRDSGEHGGSGVLRDSNIQRDSGRRAALHTAARQGSEGLVTQLRHSGFATSINSRDNDAQTPLHIAAQRGARSIVALLLDQGADIEARDKLARTPLHHAATHGHARIVRDLLDRGASPYARTRSSGYTAQMLARDRGHEDVRQILSQHVPRRNKGSVPPTEAASTHRYDRVIERPHHASGQIVRDEPRSRYEAENGCTDPKILRWD